MADYDIRLRAAIDGEHNFDNHTDIPLFASPLGATVRKNKLKNMTISLCESREELAAEVAALFADRIKAILSKSGETGLLMALGAAEEAIFEELGRRDNIAWGRIHVLSLDAHVGMPDTDPRSTGARLRRCTSAVVPAEMVHAIHGDNVSRDQEIRRFSTLFDRVQPGIGIYGIGQAGQLAFNEGPDADPSQILTVVPLGSQMRQQLVDAGIFQAQDEIPEDAFSLTTASLMSPPTVIAIATDSSQAEAVRELVGGSLSAKVPASRLLTHPDAHLFVTRDAGRHLPVTG